MNTYRVVDVKPLRRVGLDKLAIDEQLGGGLEDQRSIWFNLDASVAIASIHHHNICSYFPRHFALLHFACTQLCYRFILNCLSLPQTFPSKAVHLPCYITRVPIPFLLLTQDRFLVYSAYALEKSRSISISTAAVDWQKNRQLQFEKKKRKNNTGNLLNFNIYKMCKSPEPLFFIFCYRRDIFIYLFILLDFFRIVLRNSSPGFLKLLQSFSLYTGYSPVLPEECYS